MGQLEGALSARRRERDRPTSPSLSKVPPPPQYGLNLLNDYMQTYHANAIPPMVEAFGTKHVTYAVGKLDTLNNVMNGTIVGGCGSDYGYDNDLDALCQSELQGYCRLQRTVAWFEYVKEFFPRHFDFGADHHRLLLVDDYGYDPCGLLQSRPLRAEFRSWLGTDLLDAVAAA